MEIPPANLHTIRKLRDGRTIHIERDVSGVAESLREIDPSLRLRYSESAKVFVVYEENQDGQHLVTTSSYCDHRLVRRVRRIASPSYDYVSELEKIDAEADREKERRFTEHVHEVGERLAHAARKDLGERKNF